MQETLKYVLGEIFCLIHSSWMNCSILSDKVITVGVETDADIDSFESIFNKSISTKNLLFCFE